MRVQNKTSNKKILITLLTFGIIGLVALGYLLIAKPFDNPTNNASNDSPTTQQSGNEDTTNDETVPPIEDGDSDQPPSNPPEEQSGTATVNIPSYQVSGDTISVNVAISETWDSSAQCTMEIEGATKRTVKENVFAQAQISGCLLEASGLPSGSYTVSVYAENNGERTNTKVLRVAL